jgi:hypothetical protein
MFKALFTVIVSSLLLGFSVPSMAEDDSKTPIHISHSGEDPLGMRLGYAVKELIRGSKSFRLSNDENWSSYRIYLVSLDLARTGTTKGLVTAVGVTIVVSNIYAELENFEASESLQPGTFRHARPENPLYLTSSVHLIPRGAIEDEAKSIIAQLDTERSRHTSQSARGLNATK